MREQVPAASYGQAERDGAPHACPFKAERAQRSQDGQAGGAPTESVGQRRAGTGSGAHRGPSDIRAKARRAEGHRGAPNTATEPTTIEKIRLTPHQRWTPHTTTERQIIGEGARGAGRRADATGRGATAQGRKTGGPPKTLARPNGVTARKTQPTSTQRAPNEHSRPTIRGIMANP